MQYFTRPPRSMTAVGPSLKDGLRRLVIAPRKRENIAQILLSEMFIEQ